MTLDVNTLRYVENNNVPDARILSSANQQLMYLLDNYDLCVHTKTLGFFAPKPTGFMVKRKAEKDQTATVPKRDQQNSDPQTPTASKKGWLTASGDMKFPDLKHSK